MKRLRVNEVVVVEGKYDATALAGLIDGLILTTGGFSIFRDDEKKALLRRLGKQRGLVILTDSDAAGFKIRHYIEKIAAGSVIKNAYIPAVAGKEGRKAAPSREGTLGVEGLPPETLRLALERAGVTAAPPRAGRAITYTDLYEHGLSGGAGSGEKRRILLARLGLPGRLSKKAMLEVLNSLYSYEEFAGLAAQKPVLFWDFHGTLQKPEVTWFTVAIEAAEENAPEHPLDRDLLVKLLTGTCLPWFTIPNRDTRHVAGSEAWWAHANGHFAALYQSCGYTAAQAARIVPAVREKSLQAARYHLYGDAIPTLQALQRRGYRSFVLSNNFPELEQLVTALGLAPYFAGVITSGLAGYEKPRPEIFAHALAAAGNPAEKWMIGDNPVDDIEGGHEAGFTTVAVHCAKPPAVADYVIDELGGLLALLP